MYDNEKLLQDSDLMADFRACMKYRQETVRDVRQFYLARKYSIESIVKMQRLGYWSLLTCLPLLYLFPAGETVLWCLLHASLVVHWDVWWGNAYDGYQHFTCFSREDLTRQYGDGWGNDD